ncbi:MAG: M13 family metallopeptidase, partial [Calditrichota bacterium]
VSKPFGFFINQDLKNSTEYALYLTQSGLGLPDRAYYLTESDKFNEYREKYIAYLAKLLTLAGETDVTAKASRIMEIETSIAEKHWSRKENRDRDKTYTKVAMADLPTMVPSFEWNLFFTAADIPELDSLIVRQNTYVESLGAIFSAYTLEDWKTYLKYKLVSSAAPYLSKEFVDARFDFYGTTLSGREENSPRWKRGVRTVNRTLGEVVGKVYVQKYFKPEAKERMDKLVNNLKAAFEVGIEELEWMSAETKKQALEKLSKFNTKIGYPDEWKDYSALSIDKNELLGNIKRARMLNHQREVDKLGGPIDRNEWFMSPQTVNAYYNPPMNEIVFPAAILQPPFFNLNADDAVNYGAIGAVIGHEISHGFDDQGRKSDGDGNLRDWWKEVDADEFNARTDIMIDQYSQYNPIDTLKINGQLTLGENIADLGGLTMAYKAYKISLEGKEAPVIDEFTGSQRFFLGWAQVWQGKYRDAALRQKLITGPHSPGEYRVNGIVANMPEFYEAFDVNEG